MLTTMIRMPSKAVDRGLSLARLPLGTVARVTGQGEEWPPVLAWDGAAASVRTLVGGLLQNDELVREGRLEHARVNELRGAGELDAVAEQHRDRARAQRAAHEQQVKQRRAQVERKAEERREQVATEQAEQERKVAQRAKRRQQSVQAGREQAERSLDLAERRAKQESDKAQLRSVASRKRAVAAKVNARQADAAVEAQRSRRRAKKS